MLQKQSLAIGRCIAPQVNIDEEVIEGLLVGNAALIPVRVQRSDESEHKVYNVSAQKLMLAG